MLKKPGKSDYFNPGAYRPIALLNTLGKTLKAVMSNQIKHIAETYDLLSDTQYGARTERATETALQQITEKVHAIWGRGGKNVASLLSLDVSKAFDRVSHVRLAHNLRKRRIPDSLVRWVIDFLSERRTEIRVNEFTLLEAPVAVGIPQGSPVSPILYLFYNADLLESCENLRLYMSATGFVDDVNILMYGESTERNC
jgi:retron-type reverse transcriptase